jgi:hypothetical protein
MVTHPTSGNPHDTVVNTAPVPIRVRRSWVRVRVLQNIPGGYLCHTLVTLTTPPLLQSRVEGI